MLEWKWKLNFITFIKVNYEPFCARLCRLVAAPGRRSSSFSFLLPAVAAVTEEIKLSSSVIIFLGGINMVFPHSSKKLPERKADIIIAFFLTFSYRHSQTAAFHGQVINVDDDVRRELVGGKSENKCELLNQKKKKRLYQRKLSPEVMPFVGEGLMAGLF